MSDFYLSWVGPWPWNSKTVILFQRLVKSNSVRFRFGCRLNAIRFSLGFERCFKFCWAVGFEISYVFQRLFKFKWDLRGALNVGLTIEFEDS